MYANQVFLDARDGSVYAKAKTYSKTYQAAGTTHATSVVDMNATTLAHVGAGTAITASGKISIVSFQENVHSLAQADSAIGAGLTGSLTSTATNNSDANSNISTDSGSTLTTKDLFVQAKTLSDQHSYQTLANTDAQTVVRYIWDVVDYACHTVFKILTFRSDMRSATPSWVGCVSSPTATRMRSTMATTTATAISGSTPM